jgi:dTMP kinase
MFITLYGVNNVGKSTHCKMLVDRLKKEGFDAIHIKYPIYDLEPSGPFINKVLRSEKQHITEYELQMWFAINRHQFQDSLKNYLKKGIIVVAEDYIGTALAWGSAKGLDTQWLKHINQHLLNEDLTILINGERADHAIEAGHIHENNHELTDQVRKNLLLLAKKNKWHKVELQPTKPATHELIWQYVSKKLAKKED